MGLFDWLSIFTFAWLRRCKTCGERGGKCVCKRPSVALEHIFFLEERKNKVGARNFSHVSDTMMTTGTNSSTFTNSMTYSASAANFTGYTNSGSSNYTTAVVSSGANFTNNTVLMARESTSDCASVDYIYPPSQPSMASSAASGASNHRRLPASTSASQPHRRHHRRSHRRHEPEPEPEANALVRKHSGRMVRKATSAPADAGYARYDEFSSGEYMLMGDNVEEVGGSVRSRHVSSERSGSAKRWTHAEQLKPKPKPKQQQRSVTFRPENALVPRRGKPQQGSSFKFYGRGGNGREVMGGATPAAAARTTTTTTTLATAGASGRNTSSSSSSSSSMALTHSLASNDALALRPSTTSVASDRMSVDNNFGSYNPRAGRLLESSLAPSIQEDDEALQRLDGWLHSSPTSTADSFMMSRAMF